MTIRFTSALPEIFRSPSVLLVTSVSMLELVLPPVAVLAGVLGAWRLGTDPGWTGAFFIADGLLSRYQLWLAVAIGLQTTAFILNRWVKNRSSILPALARLETQQ